MKKLLFVALIGTFVACGEATETTESTETSVEAVETPSTDTMVVVPNDTTATDTTTAPAPAQ